MRLTKRQLYTRVKVEQWLHWQCLRRSQKYHTAVADLLKHARRKLAVSELISSLKDDGLTRAYAQLLKLHDELLQEFGSLDAKACEQLETGFWEDGTARKATSEEKPGNLFFLKRRWHWKRKVFDYLRSQATLPSELISFQRSYRILFPLPPSMPLCIRECLQAERPTGTSPGMQGDLRTWKLLLLGPKQAMFRRLKEPSSSRRGFIKSCNYSKSTGYLTIQYHPDVTAPYLKDQLETMLDKYVKGRVPRFEDRKYYETCLRIYDMKEAGKTYDEIVKAIYPEQSEENSSSYDSALSKVKQQYQMIRNRIEALGPRRRSTKVKISPKSF